MNLTEFTSATVSTPKEATALLGRIIDLASAETVFGQPLDGEGFRVLTAIEVTGGMGFALADCDADDCTASAGDADDGEQAVGIGGGGTSARPVAIVSLTSAGVRIEPIIDRTRVLVTFGLALGAGLLALARRR